MTLGTFAVASAPALAGDAPPGPVTAFNAPQCPGETDEDPADVKAAAHSGYTDLTRIFGDRLTSYNQGNVVPIYDTYGTAYDTYPALCGTYYDTKSGGPKSVWMFCTDVTKKVCGDIGPNGSLTESSSPVGDLVDQPRNTRLSQEQERIIAWLLQNGHPYSGVGSQAFGDVTEANQTSTNHRMALQTLIWCVSDPITSNADLKATCAASLSPAEQTRILSMVPGTAVLDISLKAKGGKVRVGQTRTIKLRTNVLNQPITLTATGTARTTLRVCGGRATLSGNSLRVKGADPTSSVTVKLCLTPTANGSYGLSASTKAIQSEELQWARAADPCQVFARFRHDSGAPVVDRLSFRIAKKDKPRLVTKASAQVAAPGARLFDTVKLRGFKAGHGAKGTATLYGPLAKVTAKSCRPAAKVAKVRFTPRNGSVRTPKVKVTEPGYYTWVAATSSDRKNKAASHRCGLAAETTLVRKKAYHVSQIDAGYSGTSDPFMRSGPAPRLGLAAAGIDAAVTTVGHRAGRMLIPGDVARVGQLAASAQIGDKIGTTVLAGHVSDRTDRPGALWNLNRARKNQVISYRTQGRTQRYKVVKVERISRSRALPKRLFRTTGAHRMVLISCTDKVTTNGRWHYTNNLIVTAVPIN